MDQPMSLDICECGHLRGNHSDGCGECDCPTFVQDEPRPVELAQAAMSAQFHAGRPPTVHRGSGSRPRWRHMSTVGRSTPSRSAISVIPTGMGSEIRCPTPYRVLKAVTVLGATPSSFAAWRRVRPLKASTSWAGVTSERGCGFGATPNRRIALWTVAALTPTTGAIFSLLPYWACSRSNASRSLRSALAVKDHPLTFGDRFELGHALDTPEFVADVPAVVGGVVELRGELGIGVERSGADGDHGEVSRGGGFVGQGLDLGGFHAPTVAKITTGVKDS